MGEKNDFTLSLVISGVPRGCGRGGVRTAPGMAFDKKCIQKQLKLFAVTKKIWLQKNSWIDSSCSICDFTFICYLNLWFFSSHRSGWRSTVRTKERSIVGQSGYKIWLAEALPGRAAAFSCIIRRFRSQRAVEDALSTCALADHEIDPEKKNSLQKKNA